MSGRKIHLLLMLIVVAAACPVLAQDASGGWPSNQLPGGSSSSAKPTQLKDVRLEQRLGEQIPMDLLFHDEAGNSIRLGDCFNHGRPVILTLVYFSCPQLCTLVLNDLTRTMNALQLSVGDEFDVVTVSFDPRDTPKLAAEKKKNYLNAYRRVHAEEGWHFLTGDEPQIKQLADAAGFHYAWDDRFQQYVHPSGIVVLTPQGVISRYFFGIDYDTKDLRLSLVQASNSTIGTRTDQVLLYCFHYDPATGRYGLLVTRLLKVMAVLTMAAIGTFWLLASRFGGHEPAKRPE